MKEIGVWMSRNNCYAEKPGLQSRAEFLFANFVTGTLGPRPFSASPTVSGVEPGK